MIIVDTSVWVDYFRGVQNDETTWLTAHMGDRQLAVPDLVLCEVMQGVRGDHVYPAVLRDLLGFTILDTGGQERALDSAQNYRVLRQRGLTVRNTVDCLIASFCLREGHMLLHRDRDYDIFERHLGLKVLHF